MKKVMLILLVVFAAASVAMAIGVGAIDNTDVLGAHNGYGRGCVMCHAPHSGSAGNNKPVVDSQNGAYALWGQDLTPLYGKTMVFSGDGKTTYSVTLPTQGSITSAHDANTIILFCMSCHDGQYAKVGMMKGTTVETLPIVGGNAPTLLGADGTSVTNPYANDHPVGGLAIVACGGAYNWDCASSGNTVPIAMTGTASAQFKVQYPGSFWNASSSGLAKFGTVVNAVACTTCHDQHSMNVFTNTNGSFQTSFFIRGNYVPQSGGNNAAQFCRNCHGGESNEMNGKMAVPTT
jgi:cytochrome c553